VKGRLQGWSREEPQARTSLQDNRLASATAAVTTAIEPSDKRSKIDAVPLAPALPLLARSAVQERGEQLCPGRGAAALSCDAGALCVNAQWVATALPGVKQQDLRPQRLDSLLGVLPRREPAHRLALQSAGDTGAVPRHDCDVGIAPTRSQMLVMT
jgi:hypothetical protein